MSNNKAYRATVSYLIARDLAHEKVFAKALETLGVDWNKTLPGTAGLMFLLLYRFLELTETLISNRAHMKKDNVNIL